MKSNFELHRARTKEKRFDKEKPILTWSKHIQSKIDLAVFAKFEVFYDALSCQLFKI